MGIIDRFEGDFAVVEFEGKKMANIPRESLPPEAKEGDVLRLMEGQYVVDVEATRKRKEEIANLTKDLWN